MLIDARRAVPISPDAPLIRIYREMYSNQVESRALREVATQNVMHHIHIRMNATKKMPALAASAKWEVTQTCIH